MTYRYESEAHVLNMCRKILRDKGIEIQESSLALLGDVVQRVWDSPTIYPSDLTWRIKSEVHDEGELLSVLKEFGESTTPLEPQEVDSSWKDSDYTKSLVVGELSRQLARTIGNTQDFKYFMREIEEMGLGELRSEIMDNLPFLLNRVLLGKEL